MSHSDFKAAWWLRNAHLQTLYPALFRKSSPLNSNRERVILPDGDFIDIDWCGAKKNPIVILFHGLTGSSQSGYIKGLQNQLEKLEFCSAAVNFRGCSGQANMTSRCYHSGETGDIDYVYETIRRRNPNIPVFVVGFSLGGNVVLKWLGEKKHDHAPIAGVAVSVPFVLSKCASRLDTGFSKLYRRHLLDELLEYMEAKRSSLALSGNYEELEKLTNLGDLSGINSFWQYDGRVVAKLYGFEDVNDYYKKSSSRQFLRNIKSPVLIIQADDDPFMTEDVIPAVNELSEFVHLEVTRGGGHVGFVSGLNPCQPCFWLEHRIPAFLLQYL